MKRGIIGIYRIINNTNGKVYIGQSVDVEYRICNHFSCLKHNRHDNEHLQRSYNKNPDAFSWELIKECTIEELDEEEIKMIKLYDSTNSEKGYNRSYGGQNIHKATKETRIKMSNTKKGKKFTKEHCNKIGEANRKRVLSNETKTKIAEKRSKVVLQFDKNGNFIAKYSNAIEAAKVLGLKSSSSIRHVLYGIAPTARGYIWKYEQS